MVNKQHLLTLPELEKALGTDISDGLSVREARARLEKEKKCDGAERHSLFVPHKSNYLKLALSFFTSPGIIILVVISLLAALFGNLLTGITVLIITLVGAIVGGVILQSSRKKLDSMCDFASPMVKLRRGGNHFMTDGRNVVVGDILILTKGDLLPCDARLISSESLVVKELINTRDGVRNRIVKKDHSVIYDADSDIKSPDAANMLYAGSAVLDGEALALVVATGKDTYLSGFIPEGALAGNENFDSYVEEIKPKFYRISFVCISLFAILSLLSIVTLRETSFVSNFLMLFSSIAMLSIELIRMGQGNIFSAAVDKMSRSGSNKKKRDTTAYVRGFSTPGILSNVTRLALLGRAGLYDGISHVGKVCVTSKGEILSELNTENPIGHRILTCIHTYLKAMRESCAQTSFVLDGVANSLNDHLRSVNFDVSGASLIIKSLYFTDVATGENGYAHAETNEGEYSVALSFNDNVLSLCTFARKQNGKDTDKIATPGAFSDFINNVRNTGGKPLFVVSKSNGETVLEGIVALYEQPAGDLTSVIPELNKMGIITTVMLADEEESLLTESAFAPLFDGKVAFASEFKRDKRDITSGLYEYCAYMGFSPDEYALLITAMRKNGESVAAYGIDNDYYSAMSSADVSISSDVLIYSSPKYKESIYERLAPDGRDSNIRCSQITRLLSKIIVHRTHAKGGGVLAIANTVKRSRAAILSFAYSIFFFAVLMSALIPISAASALLGIELVNAVQTVCLAVVGAILSMTVFSDAQPKPELLNSRIDFSALPSEIPDKKFLSLTVRASFVVLFACVLKILDACSVFGESPSYSMPVFIAILLSWALELLLLNLDFTGHGEGRRLSWIRFLLAYAFVLVVSGIITQKAFAEELLPHGIGTLEFIIVPVYCILHFVLIFALRFIEKRRKKA